MTNLTAAIHQAHDAIMIGGVDSGAAAILAIRQIYEAAQPEGAYVTFAQELSQAEFQQCAARVLNDCVAAWLDRVESRYLGGATSPEMLGVFLQMGGNPLAERFGEIGSLQALVHETDGLVAGALRDNFARYGDRARALLMSVCLPDFSRADARELFALLRRPDAPLTCAAILPACYDGMVGEEGDIIAHAQALKSIGQPRLALEVINRGLDEATATQGALIEKALIAKINGEFALCARLLEACYAKQPNEFLLNEIVAVLPEIEPIESILSRYAGEPGFLAIARRRANFRIGLGEEGQTAQFPQSDGHAIGDLAPEIALEFRETKGSAGDWREEIRILALGRSERWDSGAWRRKLHRIDFVRVRTASATKLVKLRVRVDGRTVGETNAVSLHYGYELSPLQHQTFNCWFDLSGIAAGPHELQLYFEEWHGGYRTHEQLVWVEPKISSPEQAVSAAIVELADDDLDGPLEDRIARLPSECFSADRQAFRGQFDRILVVRADQLGDTVQSISAILALKRHFPEAELYGLFSPAQHELVQSTGLCKELFGVDLVYDQKSRRRYATLSDQLALKRRFAPYKFDLAIDLSPGSHSRPLLRLAGARYTAGFSPSEFSWLSFGLNVHLRDPGNGHAAIAHANAPETLVEALAHAAKRKATILPKAEIDPAFLRSLGVQDGRRFAVLHAGARTASRKWPVENFIEVARRLIGESGLFVILMLDSPGDLKNPPDDLDAADFVVLKQKLTFAQFDGLLSHCAVFVGNDTGPKHLAALRGTAVVSIHMGAVNWSEWGQDGSGVIITRRVPCYGCGIELEEECGKALPCLKDVSAEEVSNKSVELTRRTT